MTSAFGELDVWLARAGRHEQLWEKLGAHLVDGGVRSAVWAPNASHVSVVGDFNDWDAGADPLAPVEETGIWEGVVDGAGLGQRYKYEIDGREKAVYELRYELNNRPDWLPIPVAGIVRLLDAEVPV